jgi:hypothetical protein
MKIEKMGLSQQYSPTMTKDYSQISDTARAVDAEVLPRMASYIRRISPRIAATSADEVFCDRRLRRCRRREFERVV